MTLFSVSVVFISGVVVAHQCGSLPLYFLCCGELGLVPLEFASNFQPLSRIIERLYSFSVRYRSNCYEKLENFIFLHSLSNSEKMLLSPHLSSCLFFCAFVI